MIISWDKCLTAIDKFEQYIQENTGSGILSSSSFVNFFVNFLLMSSFMALFFKLLFKLLVLTSILISSFLNSSDCILQSLNFLWVNSSSFILSKSSLKSSAKILFSSFFGIEYLSSPILLILRLSSKLSNFISPKLGLFLTFSFLFGDSFMFEFKLSFSSIYNKILI